MGDSRGQPASHRSHSQRQHMYQTSTMLCRLAAGEGENRCREDTTAQPGRQPTRAPLGVKLGGGRAYRFLAVFASPPAADGLWDAAVPAAIDHMIRNRNAIGRTSVNIVHASVGTVPSLRSSRYFKAQHKTKGDRVDVGVPVWGYRG